MERDGRSWRRIGEEDIDQRRFSDSARVAPAPDKPVTARR
jgi:hypothetical protein